MKQYSENTLYISAHAKLPSDMPSGEVYKAVDIGLVINPKTGEIEDMSVTLLTNEAVSFLKQIILGYNLNEDTIEPLIEKMRRRYYGGSQKAIGVALRLIYEKYLEWRKLNS